MKSKAHIVAIIFISLITKAQEIKVTTGKLIHLENVMSRYVDIRNVDVWLPDGYSDKEKYAVLYMNDGQALFDPSTTWNKQAWKADETAGKLIAEGKTQKFIIVGIYNNGKKRHPEYFPQKAYESLSEKEKLFLSEQLQKSGRINEPFQPLADKYLQFIVTELKPYIDKNYATKPDRAHTYIAGSSMGGLLSMYALCEYPDVFGGAACLSTHWSGIFTMKNNTIPNVFYAYLKTHLPNPKTHKIYFDYGDQTLDSLYKPLQQKVDAIMKQKGFTSKNWQTKFFPGKDHSENAWQERLHFPLEFLVGDSKQKQQ